MQNGSVTPHYYRGMIVTFATVASVLALGAGLIAVKDLRLPYPCFDPVVSISQEHIPAPSDLRGPYAPNRHLQKAKKLFEHRITGVGRSQILCVHKHATGHLRFLVRRRDGQHKPRRSPVLT